MTSVFTDKAPTPAGHYSQAIISGDFVFVSGQLPIDPGTGKIRKSIEEQTEQVISNIKSILTEAGSSLQKVVNATVYISDISLWGKVNDVYSMRFGGHKPARAMVSTRDLHFGCLIEIEAIAEVG